MYFDLIFNFFLQLYIIYNQTTQTSTSISSIYGSSPSYARQPFSTGTTPIQIPLSAEEEASDYCCKNKIPILHLIVISLIIGITLLVVGLVQLKPNADLEAKKFLFLYSAAACFAVGFIFMFIRCIRLYRFRKRMTSSRVLLNETSDYSLLNTFEIMDDREPHTEPFDSIALLSQRF